MSEVQLIELYWHFYISVYYARVLIFTWSPFEGKINSVQEKTTVLRCGAILVCCAGDSWGFSRASTDEFAGFSSEKPLCCPLDDISYLVHLLLRWSRWPCFWICLMCEMRSVWWAGAKNCRTSCGRWWRRQQSYCSCWRGPRGTGSGMTLSLGTVVGTGALTRSVESPLQKKQLYHHSRN